MEFIATLLKIGYDAFQIESPFFGLTFWEIAVGCFVVSLSIGIFRTFFDIQIKSWKDKEYKDK